MSIAFLDTDFILKTKDVKNKNDISLLEQTLSLGHDFYIAEKVYEELLNKDEINLLILSKKIKVFKYKECFDQLHYFYNENTIRIILKDLEEIINHTVNSKVLYDCYFKHLEQIDFKDINVFTKEFKKAVNKVPPKNNIGEIITILITGLILRVRQERILSFFSDDKGARAVATNFSTKIETFNCDSLYILLKENGITISQAKEYAKMFDKVNNNIEHKYRVRGTIKSIGFVQFLEMVYKDYFKISRKGLPELK